MSADYRQLTEFQKNLQKINDTQKEEFLQSCCKELSARLLAKAVKRTPYITKNLQRGWTNGEKRADYINNFQVRKEGTNYIIDIINPVEYASYVEYGHRKKNGKGWVPGKFMLTLSVAEINHNSEKIIMAKLKKFLEKVIQ